MDIGDRVTVTATIWSFAADRASVSVPSFNHAFSIVPRKGAKIGDEVQLFGEITWADETDKTVDFDDGGRATVKADVLTLVEKAKQQKFAGRDISRRR